MKRMLSCWLIMPILKTDSRLPDYARGSLTHSRTKGGPHEKDTNHRDSGADRRRRFGAAHGASAAAGREHARRASPGNRHCRRGQANPNLPGKRLVSHIVTTPLGRARSRTVTARLSSTPMSSRARSGARSMTSLSASTGPVRRGSRGPAPNRVSENASDTEPARLLAVLIADAGDEPLVSGPSMKKRAMPVSWAIRLYSEIQRFFSLCPRHRGAAASTVSAARTLDVPSIHVRREEKEMRKFSKDPDTISRLSPEQYRVTQQNGTEAPGTGEYLENKEPGIYVDIRHYRV